jgi:hypothetical protein
MKCPELMTLHEFPKGLVIGRQGGERQGVASRGLQAVGGRQGVIGIGLQARWQAEAAARGGRHGMRDRGEKHGVAGMRW